MQVPGQGGGFDRKVESAELSPLMNESSTKREKLSLFQKIKNFFFRKSKTTKGIQGKDITPRKEELKTLLKAGENHKKLFFKNPVLFSLLKEKARSAYVMENIHFIEAMRGVDDLDNEGKQEILDQFINNNSPEQINISGGLRDKIINAKGDELTQALKEAEKEVENSFIVNQSQIPTILREENIEKLMGNDEKIQNLFKQNVGE